MSPARTPERKAPPRKRLSADARREQIVESARRVFARSGFAGARTRDLAAEAGVNEALLYNHFRSKDELFEAAVSEPLEHAVAQLIELSGRPPDDFDVTGELMRERTRDFIRDLLEIMDDLAPLLGVMLCGDADTAARHYRERVAPSLDVIRHVVNSNLAAWSHRDFDTELTAQLVFGTTWFLALSDQLAGRTRDHDEVADQIATLIIFGLDTGQRT